MRHVLSLVVMSLMTAVVTGTAPGTGPSVAGSCNDEGKDDVMVNGGTTAAITVAVQTPSQAEQPTLQLTLRSRAQSPAEPGAWTATEKPAQWNPRRTAVVICDMWDRHWCRSATARVVEMAPRMNDLIGRLREQGVLVIHCPSNTMDFYKQSPGRRMAQQAPKAPPLRKVEVNEGSFPIDQSDGGCPDEPKCPQGKAWTRQIAALEIRDTDAVTDSEEAYNLMRQRGIDQVLIMGVHTNMCILNRPFAIRALVRKGMNVVLVRDMTDTMYNPRMRPFVDHFTGTDLVIQFIEKYWCPTITSDQVLGGKPFRFAGDRRVEKTL